MGVNQVWRCVPDMYFVMDACLRAPFSNFDGYYKGKGQPTHFKPAASLLAQGPRQL